jgi:hypothetical protein
VIENKKIAKAIVFLISRLLYATAYNVENPKIILTVTARIFNPCSSVYIRGKKINHMIPCVISVGSES